MSNARICWACGGDGGSDFIHDGMYAWVECSDCKGTGIIEWALVGDDEEPWDRDAEYCEANGHTPGCPHDPTDWDTIAKERNL